MKIFSIRHLALTAIAVPLFTNANAGEPLNIPMQIWESLTPEQQRDIENRYTPYLLPPNSYGSIMDAQSANESRSGTTTGSQLGAAVGSANYVDNAFKGSNPNYSAKSHLGASIAGAIIGSIADSAPRPQFRTRYTMKLANGKVEYIEETKPDPFRHSVGLCVALFPIRLIDLDLCTMTKDSFALKYFGQENKESSQPVVTNAAPPQQPAGTSESSQAQSFQAGDIVWAANWPTVGYALPSKSEKPRQEFSSGTSFEVIVVHKDFVRVRTASGLLIWVEKKSIRSTQPIAPVVSNASRGKDNRRASRGLILQNDLCQ